jgi:hypothetical protein
VTYLKKCHIFEEDENGRRIIGENLTIKLAEQLVTEYKIMYPEKIYGIRKIVKKAKDPQEDFDEYVNCFLLLFMAALTLFVWFCDGLF